MAVPDAYLCYSGRDGMVENFEGLATCAAPNNAANLRKNRRLSSTVRTNAAQLRAQTTSCLYLIASG